MKNIGFNLDLSQNAHVEDEYRLTINDQYMLRTYCPYRAHTLSTQNPLVVRIKNKPDWFVAAHGDGPYYIDEDGDFYSFKEDEDSQKVRIYFNEGTFRRLLYSPGTKVLLTDITVRELTEITFTLSKQQIQEHSRFPEIIEQYHQLLLDENLRKKYNLRKVYITHKGLSYRLGDVVIVMKDVDSVSKRTLSGYSGVGIILPTMLTHDTVLSPISISSVTILKPSGYEPNLSINASTLHSNQILPTGINLNQQDPDAREAAYQALLALDINTLLTDK